MFDNTRIQTLEIALLHRKEIFWSFRKLNFCCDRYCSNYAKLIKIDLVGESWIEQKILDS